jgi:hypothetical protein
MLVSLKTCIRDPGPLAPRWLCCIDLGNVQLPPPPRGGGSPWALILLPHDQSHPSGDRRGDLRRAAQQVTPAAQCRTARRVLLRATPATLAGVPGRPTRASAVSSATEATACCETCREKGTAQSMALPISVPAMIASFFMRFSHFAILEDDVLRRPSAMMQINGKDP